MRVKSLFFVCCFLSLAFIMRAQNPDSIRLDNKIIVLENKVSFALPQRAVKLLSKNAEDEAWITWETGDMKLLLFIQKLNATDDPHLFDALAKADQAKQFKTKMLNNNKQVRSMLSTATRFDSTQTAILINKLLVSTGDGFVFTVSGFVNTKGFKTKEHFQRLCEKIYANVKIKTDRGSESTLKGIIDAFSGKEDNEGTLPWVAETIHSFFKPKKKGN